MSTLPKSIQAAQEANGDHQSTSGAIVAKRLACQELINKYKNLPDDFLKIPGPRHDVTSQNNPVMDLPTQQAMDIGGTGPLVDMVDISVVEAQLVKNYGLLRMDLYCKIRVGHMVCETQTCPNGAKNPKWDGVYQFNLKPGIDSFHLEIYDEKQFSLDEKIAWLHEPIPPEIFQGITVERWFTLSGRSGPHKEGSVLLVISHKRVPMRASHYGRSMMSQHLHQISHEAGSLYTAGANSTQMIGGTPSVVPVAIPTYLPPPTSNSQADQLQQQQQLQIATERDPAALQRNQVSEFRPASEEDINQLGEMFPSIDKQIIKAILENNNHDKEAAIVALLAMG